MICAIVSLLAWLFFVCVGVFFFCISLIFSLKIPCLFLDSRKIQSGRVLSLMPDAAASSASRGAAGGGLSGGRALDGGRTGRALGG